MMGTYRELTGEGLSTGGGGRSGWGVSGHRYPQAKSFGDRVGIGAFEQT